MTETELLNVIRLKKTPFVGDITAKKLIEIFGSAENVFKEYRSLKSIKGVGERLFDELCNEENLRSAVRELDFMEKNNIDYFYYEDDNYPSNLKKCMDSPIILFSKGDISFSKTHVVSIVGTRKATKYGEHFCEELIRDLSYLDVVIVSGFAYGIDIIAHASAIKNNLPTIVCLAHGLDTFYPSAHRRYVEDILSNGCFLTDFGHKSKFVRQNFISRNRIIAGLSDVTIVVESAEKGGAMVTAGMAYDYGREVMALPGNYNSDYSKGCNKLIQEHKAHLITSGADLVEIMGWGENGKAEKNNKSEHQLELFPSLPEMTSEETKIYNFLRDNGATHINVIARENNLSLQDLSSILFFLELKNVINPLPGSIYEVR